MDYIYKNIEEYNLNKNHAIRRTRGEAQATRGCGRGCGRGRGQGRGHGRGQNRTAQNPDETWKWVSKEIVEEQNVPPVFLDHEQLNIRMQSTTPLDFFELYFTEDVVRLLVIEKLIVMLQTSWLKTRRLLRQVIQVLGRLLMKLR